MHKFLISLLILVPLLGTPSKAFAIQKVVSASPSWKTFTNKDGTGLYHEVLREIFALYDVDISHVYSKSGRAASLVLQSQADMMTCTDTPKGATVLARYPLYKNDYFVLFDKERIGEWKGTESLRDKIVLTQPTYYNEDNFPVPVIMQTIPEGKQAVGMILLGRADFYVDDMSLIKESINDCKIKLHDNISIEKAGERAYFPLFNTTERGQAIRTMYEEGIMRLHKAGKLKPIYDKWGHEYPDFDSY